MNRLKNLVVGVLAAAALTTGASAWITDKFEGDPYVGDVLFNFDKSDIRPDAKQALDYDVDWMKKNGQRVIVLEGHADSRGTKQYNLKLAQRRLDTVKKYMTDAGIAKERITEDFSFGKDKPQCLKENEKCWQSNRRVHVLVNKLGYRESP